MDRTAVIFIATLALISTLTGCDLFDEGFSGSIDEGGISTPSVATDGPSTEPVDTPPIDPPPPPTALDCGSVTGTDLDATVEGIGDETFVVHLPLELGYWGGVQVQDLVGATVDHVDVPGLNDPPTVTISMTWQDAGADLATFVLEATVLGELGEVCEVSRTFTIRRDPTLFIE